MTTIAYRDAVSYPPAVTRIFERCERIEPLLAHRNVKLQGLMRLAPLLAPDQALYDESQADFPRPHKRGGFRRRKVGGGQYSHSSLPPPHISHASLPPLQESASDLTLAQHSLVSSSNGGPLQPTPPLMPRLVPPRPHPVASSAHLAAGVYSASIVPGMPRSGSRKRRPAPNVVLRRSPSPEAVPPSWPEEGGKFPDYYNTNVITGTWSTAFLRGLHKQFLVSGTRAADATDAAEARQLKREEEQRRRDAERRKEAARNDKLVDRLAADLQRTTIATYKKKNDELQTLHENPQSVTAEETKPTVPAQNAVRLRFNMAPSVGTWFATPPPTPPSRSIERTPAIVQDLASMDDTNVLTEAKQEPSTRLPQVAQVKVNFSSLDPDHSRTKVRSELTKALNNGLLDKAVDALIEEELSSQRHLDKEDKHRQSGQSWRSGDDSLDGLPLFEDYVASLKGDSSVSGDWEVEHEVFAGDFIHQCFDHALDEAVQGSAEESTPVEVESVNEVESAVLAESSRASPIDKDKEAPTSPSREEERRELEELRAENTRLREQLASAPTSLMATRTENELGDIHTQARGVFDEVAEEELRREIEQQRQLQERQKTEADNELARQAQELELQRKKLDAEYEAAKLRAEHFAERRRASEEQDLQRKVMKSQLRSHLVESYWNGHLETDLAPKMQRQHNFEPLRTQTLDMVVSSAEDGSLMEALKKVFESSAAPSSPTRPRRDPRKLEVTRISSKELKSPSPWEIKSPRPSQRNTPELVLPTQAERQSPEPASMVPFADSYGSQGIAHALDPKASRPSSPRSPDSASPKKKRGVAALMRSLKSGEVSKIVDEMEAKEAREALHCSWPEYYNWHFKGSHIVTGLTCTLFQNYEDEELEPARPMSAVVPLPTPPQLAIY